MLTLTEVEADAGAEVGSDPDDVHRSDDQGNDIRREIMRL
jgi:hypothetical protein